MTQVGSATIFLCLIVYTVFSRRTMILGLSPKSFMLDRHIPDLLIFANGTDMHDDPLVLNGELILQDKVVYGFLILQRRKLEICSVEASCLPALCLNAEPGCSVVDACAAPGMKSTHLAALMVNRNESSADGSGRVFAFDRNKDRMEAMRRIVRQSGADNIVRCICSDFLRVPVFADPELMEVCTPLLLIAKRN